jgi:hypothetical protein
MEGYIMTTPQEQYSQAFKQTQDMVTSAFDAWTHAFQQGLGQVPGATVVDAQQVIDQVFDFAAMLLNAQREFAKQLIATSTAAADSLKNVK